MSSLPDRPARRARTLSAMMIVENQIRAITKPQNRKERTQMARTTIDYGIDLGTTNSSIAVLTDTLAEVVPNKDGSLMTPSAIWYDKRGKLYVGKDAKSRH